MHGEQYMCCAWEAEQTQFSVHTRASTSAHRSSVQMTSIETTVCRGIALSHLGHVSHVSYRSHPQWALRGETFEVDKLKLKIDRPSVQCGSTPIRYVHRVDCRWNSWSRVFVHVFLQRAVFLNKVNLQPQFDGFCFLHVCTTYLHLCPRIFRGLG